MKKCKSLGLFFSLALGAFLSACSSPVGFFDVSNKSDAIALPESRLLLEEDEPSNAPFAPLNYSKTEKELRFAAVPLKRSNYKIHIADRKFIDGKVNISNPIHEEALANSFKAEGVNDMSARYQRLSADLRRRRIGLNKFTHLAKEVVKQDLARSRVNNEIVDNNIIKAMRYREKENIEVIKEVKRHMRALYIAYRYVLNYGKVVEPTLSQSGIRSELKLFYIQVEQLAIPTIY